MRDKGLVECLALGAAAGGAGTIALQGAQMPSQKWLPAAKPERREMPELSPDALPAVRHSARSANGASPSRPVRRFLASNHLLSGETMV